MPPVAAPASSCRAEVLEAWAKDSLGPNFPLSCYRAAIANLPADLEGYSTAREDIQQALVGAIRKDGSRSAASASTDGATTSPLLATVIAGGVLLGGASIIVYAAVRRRR